MKNVVGLLLKAGITMALVACAGQSSDPLKDYRDVKAVPAHEKKSQDQTAVVQMFKLTVDGGAEKNYGNFSLNKTGHVDIKISSLGANNRIQNVEAPIISDFGGSNQPKASKVSADTIRLTWTPKASDIADGGNSARKDFKLSVAATVAGIRSGDEIDLTFTVNRDVLAPTIKGVNGLANLEAMEGKNAEFSVIVQDPNANGAAAPQVFFPEYFSTNTEAYMASAGSLVKANRKQKVNPASLGSNNYQFFFVLDLEKLPETYDRRGNLDTNASSVKLCLNIAANSVVGQRTSAQQQECFNAKYNSQAAEIKFDSAERKVVAGSENKISFKVSTENSKSSLALNNAQKQIANLNGTKNLECTSNGENSSSLNCLLTWAPVCGKVSESALKLKLTAESTLNKSTKKTSIEEQFTLDNSTCEAQAQAKAEAAKKAAEEKAAAAQKAKEERETKAKADAEAKKAAAEAKKQKSSNTEKKS